VSGPGFHAYPVPKGNEDLLEYLNGFITHLYDTGKLAELQEKWFGQAFPDLPRQSIKSVEAARAMGMTRPLYFRRIMLPQMWYAALPALVNEMTLLVKASPAIAVVGVVDLTRVTNRIAAETYEPLPPILVAGAMYILFIGFLVRLQRHLERRRERYAA